MKFGVREICDVVLKAKAAMKVGNKVFYKNEPVCYFDSLKTSTLEGASSTVYAQGGRGNARLIAWEGERTVTFTMEDALISPIGFMILSGAGLTEATADKTIKVHTTEQTDEVYVTTENDVTKVTILLKNKPYLPASATVSEANGAWTINRSATELDSKKTAIEDYIYVMLMKNGEVVSEPFIPTEGATYSDAYAESTVDGIAKYGVTFTSANNDLSEFSTTPGENVVLVDYYVEHTSNVQQVDITPDKFGGNFYLEASTLFRDTNGVDMPAEFIIPNCKVQSNFTFSMAASGDPSTFTFTMDAFPDYTRWNKTKKVLAAIQIINTSDATENFIRYGTEHDNAPGHVITNDRTGMIEPTAEEGTSTLRTVKEAYQTHQKPMIEID